MSEARPSADLRPWLASQRALRVELDQLRRTLERGSGAPRVAAVRAFEATLRQHIELERRVLLPLLAGASVPGRDAQREIGMQQAQLGELVRHLHESVAGAGAQGAVLGLLENLARRLAAHLSELDEVYLPAIAPYLDEDGRRALAGDA